MPSKKKKYNARFPPARIKKIMQTDEDVGKVAAAVPVIISRALELFIESLILKTSETTRSRSAKTLSPQHIKQTILNEKNFDFLKDLVASVPDVQQGEDEDGPPGCGPENAAPKPRGRPRKNKEKDGKTPNKRKGRPRKKKESSEDSATESASQEEGGSENDDATEEENSDEDEEDHDDAEIPAAATSSAPSWNGHPAGVHDMMRASLPSTSTAHPFPHPGYPPMSYPPTGLPPPAHHGYSHAVGPPPMPYQYPVPPPAHMSHPHMHSGAPYGPPNPPTSYMSSLPPPPPHIMSSNQQQNFDS